MIPEDEVVVNVQPTRHELGCSRESSSSRSSRTAHSDDDSLFPLLPSLRRKDTYRSDSDRSSKDQQRAMKSNFQVRLTSTCSVAPLLPCSWSELPQGRHRGTHTRSLLALQFSNLIGTVYKQGNVLFTPDGNSVLSPVGNRVSVFDLVK